MLVRTQTASAMVRVGQERMMQLALEARELVTELLHDEGAELVARKAQAMALLRVLTEAGMDHTPGLEVRLANNSFGRGLGIFVSQPVEKGEVILSLPSTLMLGGEADRTLLVHTDGSLKYYDSLPALIARERRKPSTEMRRLYMTTLPSVCPANLATRSTTDLALVETSPLHRWRTVPASTPSTAHAHPFHRPCPPCPPPMPDPSTAHAQPFHRLCPALPPPLLQPFLPIPAYSCHRPCLQPQGGDAKEGNGRAAHDDALLEVG